MNITIYKPGLIDTLCFGHSHFSVPTERGGKRHVSKSVSKVNEALTVYPDIDIIPHIFQASYTRKEQFNGETKLAYRVSEKINEGVLKVVSDVR